MKDKTIRETVRELLEPGGSMTDEALVRVLTDRLGYSDTRIKMELVDMVEEGVIVEHEGFENTYVLAENQ